MRGIDQDRRQTDIPALEGGGEMSALMRSLDWAATPIGPIERWPQSLQTAASICLASRFPILIWWGPELVMLYNDAYRPILGATKHPMALGQRGRACWPEIWHIIGPMLEGVLATGTATWSDDQLLVLDRNGYLEECYFTFSYSPIRDETGGVGGVFTAVTETTERVISARRMQTLRDLAARSREVRDIEAACRIAGETFAENPYDLPFGLLYLLDDDGSQARLAGAAGIQPGDEASPRLVDLRAAHDDAFALAQVARSGAAMLVGDLDQRFGELPQGVWRERPHAAMVLPVMLPGALLPSMLLVLAVSPHKAFDDDYRNFFELIAQQIASTFADVRAYETERQRAEALAELDRAKTAFFSNISHEFRTPLTLMLAPMEDLLQKRAGALAPEDRARLELMQRNALRLLKLVNTLLDFSRVEAGRIQASYAPTDLATLTADLASVFRSAIEGAGLRLIVDCPPLADPVYVDREMWEKIVLNLLSNAFKFTFEGEIEVALRQAGALAELTVRDTGAGIPAEELPHLFERFHRVKGAHGRTFEGSGIGLALVQELVRLHGGTVRVESEIDRGTTFTISIPTGATHLPADHIWAPPTLASTGPRREIYVEEARRWLPAPDSGLPILDFGLKPEDLQSKIQNPKSKILLADDNADMREYVLRLLSQAYEVVAVSDGAAALRAAREQSFDLVLADVMMPRLDGMELLRALRADARTRELPVILLSARAGEEARVEGLQAGADDYLVKPFSATELLARVGARVAMARLRVEAARHEQAQRESEERYRTLAEVVPSMIWTAAPDGTITYANDRWLRYCGVTPEQNARHWPELVLHPDDRERCLQAWTRALREGSDYEIEVRNRRYDGAYRWFITRAVPLRDRAGRITAWFGSTTDIHDRKQAEEALRESEARYRQLANAMPQLVWTSDTDGVVDYYNSRAAEYAGLERATDGSWNWQPMIHPDDREPTLAAWRDAARSGQLYTFEHRIQMNDGSFRWHLSRALPMSGADARIVKWFGTATDIHAQKQIEQDSHLLADIGERIRLATNAQELLDQVAQMVGEYLAVRRCIVSEIDLAHDRGLIRSAFRRGVPDIPREYKISDYSTIALAEITAGRTIVNNDVQLDPRTAAFYEATYRRIGERAYIAVPFMRDGRWHGTLWVSEDVPRAWQPREITLLETVAERVWLAVEKLRAEQALRANEERLQVLYAQEQSARSQAETASRLKDEFLATVSHELRTPLTSILGYGQMIQTRKRDEAYIVRTMEKIVRSAKAQAQLIDDLLDVSRIVTGKLRIEPRPIDMGAVIHAAIEALRPAFDAKAIRLDTKLYPEANTIVGDPNRLQQVIWNLLSNAVKFTPSGGTVRVRLESRDSHAVLSVSDTGQGISPEFLPYVFDRFRQAESTSSRAHGGLGLGLAIVRHLIEMHGGTVHVESAGAAMGATFTVRLPLAAGAAAAGSSALEAPDASGLCPPGLEGVRVLLVDDQPDIVELLQEMLAPCGALVRTAMAARDALEVLRAWQPDVLVSDIAMPGDDGYWLIDNVRALAPDQGGAIPAIALTAYVRVEDRMRVLAAGFQLYVPKPVDPDELLDAVARLAATHAAEET